jgi:hypothetical protein
MIKQNAVSPARETAFFYVHFLMFCVSSRAGGVAEPVPQI